MPKIFFDKNEKKNNPQIKDGIPNYGCIYKHIFGSAALCTLHKG